MNFKIGLIWFIIPVSLIIINDIWAYLFGFFFGKTPLIELSPKKTWEGFIGGGVMTVIFGVILSYVLSQYNYFTCSVDYSDEVNRIVILDCEREALFQNRNYDFGMVRKTATKLFNYYHFSLVYFEFSTARASLTFTEHIHINCRTLWWILCIGFQACIQN